MTKKVAFVLTKFLSIISAFLFSTTFVGAQITAGDIGNSRVEDNLNSVTNLGEPEWLDTKPKEFIDILGETIRIQNSEIDRFKTLLESGEVPTQEQMVELQMTIGSMQELNEKMQSQVLDIKLLDDAVSDFDQLIANFRNEMIQRQNNLEGDINRLWNFFLVVFAGLVLGLIGVVASIVHNLAKAKT